MRDTSSSSLNVILYSCENTFSNQKKQGYHTRLSTAQCILVRELRNNYSTALSGLTQRGSYMGEAKAVLLCIITSVIFSILIL